MRLLINAAELPSSFAAEIKLARRTTEQKTYKSISLGILFMIRVLSVYVNVDYLPKELRQASKNQK